MNTCAIIPCTATGTTRRQFALAGSAVHVTSAARRFDTVDDARRYATRHGYTVYAVHTD